MKSGAMEPCPPSEAGAQALDGQSPSARPRASMSWFATTLILINVGLAAICLLAARQFGSLASAAAYLRGDALIPDAYQRDFAAVGGQDEA
jgi:hypothetical protein